MLKSLIVMIALMFTTAASAREECKSTKLWSYSEINRTEGKSISEINRILTRFLDRVELVPPEEADYIRKELAKAFDGQVDSDRITALRGRRYYAAALLRDDVAKVMQEVEAAERATTPKDVASHLIEILSWTIPNLYQTAQSFFQTDDKRQQPTASKKDQVDMDSNIAEARFVAADILQCIVKGL